MPIPLFAAENLKVSSVPPPGFEALLTPAVSPAAAQAVLCPMWPLLAGGCRRF
ncbi:MAG: hypothetical protein INF44_01420 [Thalassospira sp.]|nr:hypothetical protein [Thalassospira sp.]